MNTGTRLTLLQSKGLNIYAVKMGTGWEMELISAGQAPIRRELSQRRVSALLQGVAAIYRDQGMFIDPLLEDGEIDLTYDTSDETLDRVFGPRPMEIVDITPPDEG